MAVWSRRHPGASGAAHVQPRRRTPCHCHYFPGAARAGQRGHNLRRLGLRIPAEISRPALRRQVNRALSVRTSGCQNPRQPASFRPVPHCLFLTDPGSLPGVPIRKNAIQPRSCPAPASGRSHTKTKENNSCNLCDCPSGLPRPRFPLLLLAPSLPGLAAHSSSPGLSPSTPGYSSRPRFPRLAPGFPPSSLPGAGQRVPAPAAPAPARPDLPGRGSVHAPPVSFFNAAVHALHCNLGHRVADGSPCRFCRSRLQGLLPGFFCVPGLCL